jgi:GNAT superfamily N-acetyltransferase
MPANLIRNARPNDAPAIARLLDQLGYPCQPAEVPHRLERLGGGRRCEVFVAELEGEVIGLATVHLLAVINRPRDVAWLTALVIDEKVRGQGIGRLMVQWVEAFARAAGCERLSVSTQEHRADAHAFYHRLGMDHTGRRFGKALRQDGEK